MKTIVASFVTCFILSSAVGAPQDEKPSPTVVATGADYRKMERVTWKGQPGQGRAHTNGYTELESGMNYQEKGEWKATEAKIERVEGGAQAIKGNHKAYFAANLNTRGAIRLTMPSGTELKSHVLGLSFYDSATGKSALIGEIQDSIGEVVPPNQVIYPDAFTDIKADVRYTYKKGGFEQDVILQEQLPAPEEYGLNSDTTVLQVLTEFLEPPVPTSSVKTLKNEQRDETLRFDSMRMGPGTAFSLGEKEGDLEGRFANRAARGVPVSKSWSKLDGRNFLIEAVPFNEAKTHLDKLPAAKELAGIQGKANKQGAASRTLPEMPLAQRQGKQMIVASLPVRNSGFVIDYFVVLDTYPTLADYVFQGDTTYYISGEVYLYGSVTLEGGTVLKFAADAYPRIYLYDGAFRCLTTMYRPAVFTDMNDDSVGEIIAGSTGTPVIYLGCLDVQDGDFSLNNVRFCYADWPVSLRSGVDAVDIRDVQFVHCGAPLEILGQTVSLKNVLMSRCGYPFIGAYYTLNAENCTIDGAVQLTAEWYGTGSAMVNLTNSIVIGVTNLGTAASITTNYTYLRTNYVSGLFQTVGAASYYLATNSIYRDVGTTNINATLLSNLRKKTTYPPVVYSNVIYTNDLTLSINAQRDTDTPDLGYHYDPLDYAIGGLYVTNAVVRINPGTAVATFAPSSGYGFTIQEGAELVCVGQLNNLNYIAKYNTVQEQSNTNWTGGELTSFYSSWGTGTPAPKAEFRHTIWSMPAGAAVHFYASVGHMTNLSFRDCEIYSGYIYSSGPCIFLTNNLFHRVVTLLDYAPVAKLQNNTFYGGALEFYSDSTWSFYDNIFFETLLNGDVTNDYNAFYNTPYTITSGGSSNVTVTNITFQTGALGDFYLATNNIKLLNTGSTNAHLLTLYHYTTATNQIKETNTIVDRGYHYVAVNGNGEAIDTNGNGTPDYLEDASGSGQSVNIHLVTPLDNSYFAEPATVPLLASVIDWQSIVTNVVFLKATNNLAVDVASPYEFSWPLVASGNYSLTAVAYSTSGLRATSAPVSITITNVCTNP